MDTFIDIFFREKFCGHSLAKRILLGIAMVGLAYFGMETFMGAVQGLPLFAAGALGFIGAAFKGVDWDDDFHRTDNDLMSSNWTLSNDD